MNDTLDLDRLGLDARLLNEAANLTGPDLTDWLDHLPDDQHDAGQRVASYLLLDTDLYEQVWNIPPAPEGEERHRVTARDWQDVPEGHYAIPITEDDGLLLGYVIYHRTVPRTLANGRKRGRNQIAEGEPIVVGGYPGQLGERIRELRQAHRKLYGGFDGHLNWIVDQLLGSDLTLNRSRAQFGRLIGKCGCCGRWLTDPESKMRGIGPDCWEDLGYPDLLDPRTYQAPVDPEPAADPEHVDSLF